MNIGDVFLHDYALHSLWWLPLQTAVAFHQAKETQDVLEDERQGGARSLQDLDEVSVGAFASLVARFSIIAHPYFFAHPQRFVMVQCDRL